MQAAPREPHRQIPQGASPGMNILPWLLYIPRAKFRLFLRFKGPASKWTGISPRGRLQPPPCPKTRSGALRYTLPCSDTPYSAATRPCRTSPHITARQTYPDVARPPTVLHPTPFKRPSSRTFQTAHRSVRSLHILPRPLAQLIHGRAEPLPRFPCCQRPVHAPGWRVYRDAVPDRYAETQGRTAQVLSFRLTGPDYAGYEDDTGISWIASPPVQPSI